MSKQSLSGESSFTSRSNLKSGAERYLSQVVQYAFDNHWRTPQDFLEHFKPLDLMRGLDTAPDLRGRILTKAVGFHERIARKKSAESAAEDIRIALEEGVTTPADILELLSPDDRVTYLDRERLFAFAIDRNFFASAKEAEPERAIDRMMFLLETALGEGLISLADIGDGVTFSTIAQSLPVDELRRVVEAALRHGRASEPLTEARLLQVVSLRGIVKNIPLNLIWNNVILTRVAGPAGFAKGSILPAARTSEPPARTSEAPARQVSEPPIETRPPAPKAKETTPPPPRPAGSPAPVRNGKPAESETSGTSSDAPASTEEDIARKRVLDKLASIQRLPPRHGELSNQILFAIESMYAELADAGSDDERRGCIHDSFPNEQHMATALLALIELLEPSINVKDPEIAKADTDSLINVFLIEERDARERGNQRPSATPPPLPGVALPATTTGGRRSAAPPPLPKAR